MLFRRAFLCALFVGLLAGSLLTALQHWQVLPLIAAAERFEKAAEAPGADHVPEVAQVHADGHAHDHAAENGHGHEGTPWEPADGLERNLWTLAANIATAIGLALLVLPVMAAWDARCPEPRVSWRSGLLWGVAGFFSFFVLPGLGLPPEIPGAAAADLHSRQLWWLLAVACGALACGAVGLSRHPRRWLALGLLALPFASGAPAPAGDAFAAFPPAVAAQMHGIAHDFILAAGLAIGLYWLALGAAAGFAVRRWLRPVVLATLHGPAPTVAPRS